MRHVSIDHLLEAGTIGAHAKLKSAHDGLERHQDLLGDVVDDHLVDLHLLIIEHIKCVAI